jgi:hypothetical protein
MPNGASNQIYNGGLRCNNREVQEWRSEYRTAKGKPSAPEGRPKGKRGRERRGAPRREGERNCAPACPSFLLPSFISDGNAGEEAGEGGAHEAIYREEEERPGLSRAGRASHLSSAASERGGARDGGLRRLRRVGRRRAHLLRRQGPSYNGLPLPPLRFFVSRLFQRSHGNSFCFLLLLLALGLGV